MLPYDDNKAPLNAPEHPEAPWWEVLADRAKDILSAADGDEANSSCSGPSMSASLKPWFRSRRRRRLFSSRTFRAAA